MSNVERIVAIASQTYNDELEQIVSQASIFNTTVAAAIWRPGQIL
jgi:hypothetical protein